MAHVDRTTTEHSVEHSMSRARALFKADHPRDIDRHIDFFGTQGASTRDMCGEALLDALTGGEAEEVSSCA